MTTSNASDFELLVKIGRYDTKALEVIYSRYGSNVYGLALQVLKSPDLAQDVTQEVFIDLWNHPEKCDLARGSLKTYLTTKAHSKAVDIIRSESARQARHLKFFKRDNQLGIDVELEATKAINAQWVRSVLNGLSNEEKRAIELTYFDGFSYREAAKIVGDPEGTFKSRIRSALSKLRAALGSTQENQSLIKDKGENYELD
jgi:RNA polymerase sigma-70 factor (ECF subfamily)